MRPHGVMVGTLVAGLVMIPLCALSATAPSRTAATRGVAGASAARQVLPWIEDDYTRAVAEARARKLPIFVESWAPW